MNRNILLAAATFVVGIAIGAYVGYLAGEKAGRAQPPAAIAAAPMPPPGMGSPPPGMGVPPPGMGAAPAPDAAASTAAIQALQRIPDLEQVVQRDPKIRAAWVDLGNAYFDTHQPQKAVAAYQKALELKGDDPDVLTDQGVMYRDLGQFDEAIANFRKANQVNPSHVQSLFNMGVVYLHNLHDVAKARAAWQKVVDTAPGSTQAAEARAQIRELDDLARKK